MKKILIAVILLCAAAVLLSPFWIRWAAQAALERAFPSAEVSLGAFVWEKNTVNSSLDVKHKDYVLHISKITLDRHLHLLIASPRITIKQIPKKSRPKPESQTTAAKLTSSKTSRPSKPFLLVRSVEIRDGRISYDKFDLLNIQGRIALDQTPYTANLTASLLEAQLTTAINLFPPDASKGWTYDITIDVNDMALERWTEKMKLQNKVSLSGKLLGKINVSGDFSGLHSLNGTLQAGPAGGDLVIEDKTVLSKLAANMRQPVELVEAGFKEYHFDTGTLSVGMSERDLDLAVNMQGEKGKRDFSIKLHDVL